ncbi:MAG: TlpA family protein disulfide reductase [Leptospiraceae bacterium]|nr:TlpA family protein disulfide reductase [Leptospiraceae bacterium]
MSRFCLILFFSICLTYCKAGRKSNFGVENYKGYTLKNEFIQLRDLNFSRIAMNVYSPTCVPCFKEIPTLNFLARDMKQKNQGEFFLVVDPFNILENPSGLTREERISKSIEIMSKEKESRNIELTVLIMEDEFKVEPPPSRGGLVTGTPETLLFKTKPLTLYYNFIGSICEKQSLEEITNDPKVQFFQKQIGGI